LTCAEPFAAPRGAPSHRWGAYAILIAQGLDNSKPHVTGAGSDSLLVAAIAARTRRFDIHKEAGLKKAASGARSRVTIPGGRNVIDSRRLLYFYHVARMGSFSAAEAILGVAQPALSRQIQQLEEDLGTQLLERNGRGVSLTQYGQILQKQALTILGEMSNALEQLQLARRKPTGQISIAAPAGAMAYYMPEILRRYVAAFPEIQVTATQASTGEVYDQLAGGLTDVAIIVEPRSSHKMICQRLMVEPLWLVGRRDHEIAKLEYVDRKQLADIKLMLPGSPHGMRENIDRYANHGGIESK
jgi:DNA-binding transcriptional LysR family regulator